MQKKKNTKSVQPSRAVNLNAPEVGTVLNTTSYELKYPELYSELSAQYDLACPGMPQTYMLSDDAFQQLKNFKAETKS